MTGTIRRLQRRFRDRLAILRRTQLACAEQRKRQQAKEWAKKLDDIKESRRYLTSNICPWCDSEIHIELEEKFVSKRSGYGGRWVLTVADKHQHCHCQTVATDELLVRLIRNLAGISFPHSQPKDEWWGWHSGKAGFQNCGPAYWDNVVKESEDCES